MITAGNVFVSACRDTCIVLAVKQRQVQFATKRKGYVDVESCSAQRFAHDWPLHLQSYPALRAVRMYLDSDLRKEDHAVAALRQLRARLR